MTLVRRPVAVLVGPMGSGKSTIGSALAARCGVGFTDTDHEIEERSGRRIPEIFAVDGEGAFRRLEAEVVAEVVTTHDGVVSLGGGAVMTQAVRDALAGHVVVYLQIGSDTGFARVASSDRPLLADPDPAARYAELLALREPTYRDVSTIVVDAGRPPRVVVDEIVERLPCRAETSDEVVPNPARSEQE